MKQKRQAILLPAHDWLVEVAANFAREMARRRGLAGIALVHGSKDARQALHTNAFEEVVDVVKDLDLGAADANASNNLKVLESFERAHGGACLWQYIIQDARRRYKKYGLQRYNYNQILEYLSHSAGQLESVFSRWEVLAAVGELTSPLYRMAHQMCGVERPYLAPMTARFFHRIYFDDDLYLCWNACVRTYHQFLQDGIPPEVEEIVRPMVQEIGQGKLRPTYFDAARAKAAKETVPGSARPSAWAGYAQGIWFDNVVDGLKNPDGEHWSYWLPPRNIARRVQFALRSRFYHRHALNQVPDDGRYALFLPNSEPEYTLDAQGWPFSDQASLIRTIAQSLPVDMLLLVKDHLFMAGQRPIEFYRRILSLPNVRLVNERIYSQDLLRASEIAFTVTGTIALEAVSSGIPAIMFGKAFLNHLEGVTVIQDLYELPGAVQSALNGSSADFGRSARAMLCGDVHLFVPRSSRRRDFGTWGRPCRQPGSSWRCAGRGTLPSRHPHCCWRRREIGARAIDLRSPGNFTPSGSRAMHTTQNTTSHSVCGGDCAHPVNHSESACRQACVHRLFELQARDHSHFLAVSDSRQSLSYGDLDRRANRLAHCLRSAGAGAEKLVGICLDRSVDFVVAALATLKSGAAYLPLDPDCPGERLAFMLHDARAQITVTDRANRERLPSGPWKVIALEPEGSDIDCSSDAPLDGGAAPDSLAYVIYTSGSTGQPKGVEITHGSLFNLVSWHQKAFAVTSADRATHLASPAFDAAVWELWPYLTAGASVHIPDESVRLSAEHLRDWIVEKRVSITFVPSAMAEQILALEWPRISALRYMLTGGERLRSRPLPTSAFALINNYGPTEATVVTTSGMVTAGTDQVRLPVIGKPVSNASVHLLDENLQPVPEGGIGEIFIGGAGLARGYLNRPELTADRFIPDPFCSGRGARMYRSGDLARHRPDGALEFMGRIDDQVKIRGFRVELGEIEAVLGQHSGVRAAVVTLQEAPRGEARLIAYIVPPPGPLPTSHELRAFLRQKLPDWMLPARFEFLPALPNTQSGKVDRSALPLPGSSREIPLHAEAAPQTELEKKLERAFSEAVGLDWVSLDEDFFEIGGDSIRALSLLSTAEQALGQEISLRSLFQAPTVRKLAVLLSDASLSVGVNGALPIQPLGSRPPFFCVDAGPRVRLLAQRLGPDQPFLGLVFDEVRPLRQPVPYRVEDMAAILLTKMRQQQPAGPYYLGGWCFGGILAYEIAQQLRAKGEQVGLLIMIDPDAPLRLRQAVPRGLAARVSRLGRTAASLWPVVKEGELVWLGRAIKRQLREFSLRAHYIVYRCCLRVGLAIPDKLRDWHYANQFSLLDYRPKSCGLPVALIRGLPTPGVPPVEEEDAAWRALISGKLDVRLVPTLLDGYMFQEPNVRVLANILGDLIIRAQEAAAGRRSQDTNGGR